jgi:hypothetical protein
MMQSFLQRVYAQFTGMSAMTKGIVIGLAFGFVFGGCVCRSWRQAVIESSAPEGYSFGALYEPEYSDRVVSGFRQPFFGDAGKQLVEQAERKTVILTEAYQQVTGKQWPAHDQDGTGCCVGEGWSAALEILTCVQIKLGHAHEYKPISAAAIYALAREHGDMLGGGDGAVPADAAAALLDTGCVTCEQAGDTNGVSGTAKQHAALAKKWGRSGLPRELKAKCGDFKLGTVSKVRTPEEVEAAIRNGYLVPIASTVGFEGRGGFKRDANGFCYSGGTWPHQMVCAGFVLDAAGPGVHGFLILQSWGEVMPSGPKPDWMPPCGFLITWRDMQRIVEQGTCFAVSNFNAFPAQDVPLFIRAPAGTERWFAKRKFDLRLAW